MSLLSALFFFLLSFNPGLRAWATSPLRSPELGYQVYFHKEENKDSPPVRYDTPLNTAQLYPEAKLRPVVLWPSYQSVVEHFKHVRDAKVLQWRNLNRRISWLYPDNGCYVRAALVTRLLKDRSIPVKTPEKVFVFGNLKATTVNSPKGEVTWWYHVAPIVQVGKQKFVLDPGLQPKAPLTLEKWLARLGDPTQIKIAICASGTYVPRSSCSRATDGMEHSAQRILPHFLDLEWQRLLTLGRDPLKELGDLPPWR